MSMINLFLQKRKMHENQHGFLMVAAAYALSVLMLIMGSDVFYNINSSAAGIITDTYEETQNVTKEELIVSLTTDFLIGQTLSKLMSPYGLTEATGTGLGKALVQEVPYQGDTIWILGSAISEDEFDSLIKTSAVMLKSSAENSTTAIAEDTKAASTKDIYSLTTEETVNSSVISITEEEVHMLERIVEAEATGEDLVGKILVANVIINRIADEEFPDTVEDVIFQNVGGDYQFSPVSDERYWSVDITEETEDAVQQALQGEDYSEGALYFVSRKRTSSSSAKWFDQNLEWLFKHGGHEFYKNK